MTGSPPSGSGSPPRMRGKPKRPHRSRRYPRITPAHAGKTTHATPPKPRRTDHPRACGENPRLIGLQRADDGSPPRMRGKQRKGALQDASRRITPAHAGKTAQRRSTRCFTTDHPRACGENRPDGRPCGAHGGSPPRMRGKPLCAPRFTVPTRITPAHAGKTQSGLMASTRAADHPRACGENHVMSPAA